ncbi:MAG: hypothetical protein WCJ58_08695 [bacterium]
MNLLEKLAREYVNLKVNGVPIKLPYYNVSDSTDNQEKIIGKFAGKGTADQLYHEIDQLFQQNSAISKLDQNQLRLKLKELGIGVDCSGYVYNILNEYVQATTGMQLDYQIRRFDGIFGYIDLLMNTNNRVNKISAKVLTSKFNIDQINSVKTMKVGDMIRLTHQGYPGKHVALILSVDQQQIIYTHSSDSLNIAKEEGPHISRILVKNPLQGLAMQEWEEETRAGQNYGKVCFLPENDDYVCRLKCFK